MTDRLREMAEGLAERARVPDGPFLGDVRLPTYDELTNEIHAALLSARDEALEEAAGVVQGANELQRMSALSSVHVLCGVAQSIRSLKSKVTP